MASTNSAILKLANEAIQQGDYEGFLRHCTEDVIWTFIGDRVLKGKEAVRRYMAEVYQEPPRFKVAQLIDGGDYVTALGTISLTNEKGKVVENSYYDVWKFRDGRMAELQAFVIEIGDEG